MAWLFYGFRSQKYDFLFREELSDYLSSDVLSRLSIAESRGDSQKQYIQDVIVAEGEEIWRLLSERPDSRIYLCGDEMTMIKGVNDALAAICVTHGGCTQEETVVLLRKWTAEGRILRDIWV